MAIVTGEPAPITARTASRGNLKHARLVSALLAEQKPTVHLAHLTPDPYLVQAGEVAYDTGLGISSVSGSYVDPSAISTGSKLTPAAAATGADYRFLPYTADTSGTTWFAHGQSSAVYPQLRRFSLTSVVDPKIESSYYFVQHRPQLRVAAPAYCINGNGYFKINTAASGTAGRSRCTFLMVFVPHHGADAYYPIYSSRFLTANGFNKRIEFWYVNGHIKMIVGGHVTAILPTYLNAYEPVIFGWSFDVNGFTHINRDLPTARLFLYDRGSYVTNVIAKYRYGWDFNGWVGARPTTDGGSTADWQHSGDMDILEIDMWNSALNKNQLLNVCGLLRQVYGIGR